MKWPDVSTGLSGSVEIPAKRVLKELQGSVPRCRTAGDEEEYGKGPGIADIPPNHGMRVVSAQVPDVSDSYGSIH